MKDLHFCERFPFQFLQN